MHLTIALPLLLAAGPMAGRSTCTLMIKQLMPTAVTPSFAVLRSTPDSLSDGKYFAVATRDVYARQPDRPRTREVEIHGQVFELVHAEGQDADAVARSSRVLVVWWGYDMACRKYPPFRSVRVPRGDVFILAAPRDPSGWVSGLPTYDVLGSDFVYAPELPVPRTPTRTLTPMSMADFLEMFRLLPDSAVFARDPTAAVSRLFAWGAADTTRRSQWPAMGPLCTALSLQPPFRGQC